MLDDSSTLDSRNTPLGWLPHSTSCRSFTIVDNWILDSDLSLHEKMVYIAIKRLMKQCDHVTVPHLEIMRICSLSQSAVKRAVRDLSKRGVLAVRPNKYTFSPNDYSLRDYRGSVGASCFALRGSDRPTVRGSVGPTKANTALKHMHRSIVCCPCKKSITDTITLLDDSGYEYEACPKCRSALVIDTEKLPIKVDVRSLLDILKKNDPESVFLAIDVILHKHRSGQDISNLSGLLVTMLKYGVIIPETYLSPDKRRKREGQAKKLTSERKSKREAEKEEYLRYRKLAEAKNDSLTELEKMKLRTRASKSLPSALRSLEKCVEEKIMELLIDDVKASSINKSGDNGNER